MTPDTIVIGGGIVGVSIAYHLVKRGVRTTLIDRADPGRATDAAAGIVSAETGAGPPDDWAHLARAAADYYPTLLSSLGVGEDACGYRRCGILRVASDEDELAGAVNFAAAARRDPASDLREVDPDEAIGLLPRMRRPLRAWYSPSGARVDGRLLAAALLGAAQRAGLALHVGGVDQLDTVGDRIVAARVGGEPLAARQFVIAGGAWSSSLAQQLGAELGVVPQRGQLAHLEVDEIDTGGWPMVEGFRGHYILAWPKGRIVAGATRESEAGFAAELTAAGLAEVLDEAVRVMPILDQAALTEMRVGLRPRSSDGLPIIGSLRSVPNCLIATGHGAHGLQLGPYTGELVARLLAGESVPELSAFSPARLAIAGQ